MHSLTKVAAISLTALLPAVAQTHYCIGGDLDHLTAAEVNSCKVSMNAVREEVRQHGAPSGWRFLLVCDDASWQDVAALTGRDTAALRDANFQTDRAMQITFLRRSALHTQDGGTAHLMSAALHSLPSRSAEPSPMPNVEQKREQPTVLIAEGQVPDAHHQDEAASGQ